MRPVGPVHLCRELLIAVEPGQSQQFGVELRLDRTDRDVLAVRALVHVVEVGPGVEQTLAALVNVVHTHLAQRPEHRHQDRRAIHHGGVDHLAVTTALGLEQGAHDTERQKHATTAEVAHHVHRRRRRLSGPAEVGERPGERDVVDVVAGSG